MRLLLGRGPAPMRARWAASSRRALQPSRDGHMAGPLPDAADVSNCCWRLLERQTATAAAAAAAGWTRWLGAAGRLRISRQSCGSGGDSRGLGWELVVSLGISLSLSSSGGKQ